MTEQAAPEESAEISWPLDATTIDGTVVRPSGAGPFPAVVMVAGSGPTDRDWNSPLLPGPNGSARLLQIKGRIARRPVMRHGECGSRRDCDGEDLTNVSNLLHDGLPRITTAIRPSGVEQSIRHQCRMGADSDTR